MGGTLHVVVNNQIGFTTGPSDARSSTYATDIAKMLQIPIFHVNGEDPEAVAQVVRLSMDFRTQFKRDVVINMYGYRRLGHNEGDEPAFTQPVLYRAIAKRKSVREGYLRTFAQAARRSGPWRKRTTIAAKRREMLESELSESQKKLRATEPNSARAREPRKPATGSNAFYKGGTEPSGIELVKRRACRKTKSMANRPKPSPRGFQSAR